jgi:hypothetical protein
MLNYHHFNHYFPVDKYDTLEYYQVKCYNDIMCACGIIYLSIRNIVGIRNGGPSTNE